MHLCAYLTTRVDVIKFAADKFPHALVRRDKDGRTPLEHAQRNATRANHVAILRCLEESTAKYPSLLNQITAKCCLVTMKRNGMTEYVARTPLNDLTQPQFVFMVLDMMKNCAMQPLVELILSYVGTNVGLPVEKINAGFEVKRLRQEMWEATQQQQVSEAAQKQQAAQLDARISRLEQTLAEQEASRKRDMAEQEASRTEQEASRKRDLAEQEASRKRDHHAVMAALAAIRGLPAEQGEGDGGGPSKKRKENGA